MPSTDALMRWLSGKAQGFLGVKGVHTQLAQIHEQLQTSAAAAIECQQVAMESMRATVAAMNVGVLNRLPSLEASRSDLEALRSLESQGLFILGCARSGTAVLTRSLNRSPDIMLLEEASFFLRQEIADFTMFFNQLHASWGNRCIKGTYLAPPLVLENGLLPTLLRLGRDYRYIGEKIAVGPRGYPSTWPQAYLDFQARYFLRSKYLYIVRTPVEVVWSMRKLFPDRPIPWFFETWLQTIAVSLDAYQVFPNSRVLFLEDLGQPTIERIIQWLGLPVPKLPATIGRKYMSSALSPGEVPESLAPYGDWCRECTAIYRDLRASFSREEFVYCGATSEWSYLDSVLRRIESLLDDVTAAVSVITRQLRVAA
jgi:hypothetical protein